MMKHHHAYDKNHHPHDKNHHVDQAKIILKWNSL